MYLSIYIYLNVTQPTEEESASGGSDEEVVGGQRQHLHDARQLLHFVLAGEERVAGVQLRQDAA